MSRSQPPQDPPGGGVGWGLRLAYVSLLALLAATVLLFATADPAAAPCQISAAENRRPRPLPCLLPMTDFGPSSVTVSVRQQLDATRHIDFRLEFIAATPDEAHEKGQQFHALLGAFVAGYVEADSE